MKLEVGMYIRYVDMFKNNIKIDKIREISDNNTILTLENNITHKDSVIKASHNPINLIEIGDYVNGYKVIGFDETYFNGTDKRKEPKRIEIIIDNSKFEFENHIKKEDIKTILTKEQFENNCFRIGE